MIQSQRDGIATKTRWCIEHADGIGYYPVRPMRTLHLTWPEFQAAVLAGERPKPDCSEFVDDLFRWEGTKDPCGLGFDGYGDTDSLLMLPQFTDYKKVHTATIVVFYMDGLLNSHAAVVLEPNQADPTNPLLGSHGGPNGPIEIPLKELLAALPGRSVHLCAVAHL